MNLFFFQSCCVFFVFVKLLLCHIFFSISFYKVMWNLLLFKSLVARITVISCSCFTVSDRLSTYWQSVIFWCCYPLTSSKCRKIGNWLSCVLGIDCANGEIPSEDNSDMRIEKQLQLTLEVKKCAYSLCPVFFPISTFVLQQIYLYDSHRKGCRLNMLNCLNHSMGQEYKRDG